MDYVAPVNLLFQNTLPYQSSMLGLSSYAGSDSFAMPFQLSCPALSAWGSLDNYIVLDNEYFSAASSVSCSILTEHTLIDLGPYALDWLAIPAYLE